MMSSQSNEKPSAAEEPHPEIRAVLQQRANTPTPATISLSPEGARAFSEQMSLTAEEPTPIGNVMNLKIGNQADEVPIRVYVPETEGPHPAVIYLHGGGWVLGNLDMFDETCRRIVKESEAMVISVDYRLAPEHQFPIPLEDCYTAVKWVFDNAESMQIDSDNVAIAGDSSGGNLAAAVAQLARDRGGPSLVRQLLIYPVTNYAFDTESYEENAEGYLLTRADMQDFWDMYLGDEIHGMNPYASPLQARNLEGLPPTTLITCGFDPLRDEGVAYAERLRDAGVDINTIHYDDAIHGIVRMVVEPMDLTLANEMIDELAADLKESFE
jgi:acetyl esterase